MKHARPDYDRIQDPAGKIPMDEPVFLIRGQDILAPAVVDYWAALAESRGASPHIVEAAREQARAMRQWGFDHSAKIPDMPVRSPASAQVTEEPGHHKLDNDRQVFFYEQDFYVLSNFSSFEVTIDGVTYKSAEHAYHHAKFLGADASLARSEVYMATSAHDAFKLAQSWKAVQREDWNDVRLEVMRRILRAKADQHEYVSRKLLATGDRELIEDSWRDDFWGWGPNRDGQNMLGKLWMEIRAEFRVGALTFRLPKM